MNDPRVRHLIVLMLENRSMDHMLGYLDYPPEVDFEGLRGRELEMGNPLKDGSLSFPGPNARYEIDPGPNHSHDSVMIQLLGSTPRSFPYQVTCNGYARDYEALNPKNPSAALQSFIPDQLPLLSKLAKEFAVCDHWFCSVPGATWPNRNFAHAATSDGEVDIRLRSYQNKTIFHQLEEANRPWAVYYSGFPPQALIFTDLWTSPDRGGLHHFKPIQSLYRAIQHDRLPDYAFVEPDMFGRISDSQHPGMGGEMDFRAAERLIWRIYSALCANRSVFDKTLLLITYDEHGGFFDHVPPPQGPEWSVDPSYEEENGYTFKFDLLGPRVPAVLVSPWITPGTVDHTVYDHSSIPATVRKLLQIQASPLSSRDARANTFERVLNAQFPREQLPQLEEPFVDDSMRSLPEGLELRDSLGWILREMIWTKLLSRSLKSSAKFSLQESALAGSSADLPVLEAEITRQVIADIGSQLSPEAQRLLSEGHTLENMDPEAKQRAPSPDTGVSPPPSPPAGPERLPAIVTVIRHKLELLLEDLSLVDDATRLADYFLRKYFEQPRLMLHTVDGHSIQQPDELALRTALEALFDRQDPQTRVWLADHKDRWLTIHSDGRAIFHDLEPGEVHAVENVDLNQVLAWFDRLKEGDIPAIRTGFLRHMSS